MILQAEWLVPPWTPISWSGKLSSSGQTILRGKEGPSNSFWSSPRTTPTRHHKLGFWPKCFIPTFMPMGRSVWIFYRISGVQFMIFQPFWPRSRVFCAIQILLRQRTPRLVGYSMKIEENIIAVLGKLLNRVGSMSKCNNYRDALKVVPCHFHSRYWI